MILDSDAYWMAKALDLAKTAESQGEIPVGAVLIDTAGQCIGYGFNAMISKHDPTAHAEIQTLRMAANHLGNYRLLGTTLYVTLEPCPMCAGALVHARIQRLVFATRDLKTGAAGSVCNLFHPHLANHRIQIDEGILQAPCSALLTAFFKNK